jgi:hypothetical protein
MSKIGWISLALVAVAAGVLLAACGGMNSRQAAVTIASPAEATLDSVQAALAPAGPTLGSQRQGDVLAWLRSDPAQPRRGTAAMDAYLVDTQGQPIADAKVTFDTDMTNMSHGLYLVPAQPAGDGHYVGEVHFSMPGPWRVIAVVERPGRETTKLRFEFQVNFK